MMLNTLLGRFKTLYRGLSLDVELSWGSTSWEEHSIVQIQQETKDFEIYSNIQCFVLSSIILASNGEV